MFIRRALLILAITASCTAFAGESPYLTSKQLDITAFMPTPVVNGSSEERAQQAFVGAAQKSASSERITAANSDAEETVYAIFSNVLGAQFKAANLPVFTAMFERIGDIEDTVVDTVKGYFGRIRPFMNTPKVKALVKPSKSGSYPSGQTSRSTMVAVILNSMLPENRTAIFVRANDYAQSGVIGGMHYPDDLEAVRRAGSATAATLLGSPTFRTDFEAPRTELRKVLGLQ